MLAMLGSMALAAAAAGPSISDIAPITLRDGINKVPGFMPDGSAATIVQAWRGNGNAHSYHVWLVLASSSEGHTAGVVGIDGADAGVGDIVRDDPFDGERVLGAVRFAHGKVDGQPATLLLKSDLDPTPNGVLADHATATVRIFRLAITDGIGETPYVFEPISTTQTTKRYCNAELALAQVLNLPLSKNFAGANRDDGCFER